MTQTVYELIPFICQYSKLTEWLPPAEGTLKDRRSMRIEITNAIEATGYEWHMKPGAVYLNRDDHRVLERHEVFYVPIGIMGGLPSDHFLLTDGQELDYENDI